MNEIHPLHPDQLEPYVHGLPAVDWVLEQIAQAGWAVGVLCTPKSVDWNDEGWACVAWRPDAAMWSLDHYHTGCSAGDAAMKCAKALGVIEE